VEKLSLAPRYRPGAAVLLPTKKQRYRQQQDDMQKFAISKAIPNYEPRCD
jgi:hypothetical protein